MNAFKIGQKVVKRGIGCIGTIAKFRGSFALVVYGDHPSDRDWLSISDLELASEPCSCGADDCKFGCRPGEAS